ncbi:MAG: hypothetical protein ABFD46_00225 [Armatimonadota bacterium]
MYTTLPAFVLGFHGCDQSVVDKVVSGSSSLQRSKNDYDWLGHGIYFWENDPARALEYAEMLKRHPRRGQVQISRPAVLGAVINLGYCLNLMEADALELLRSAYDSLKTSFENAGENLPINAPGSGNRNDLLLRQLDCAIIQFLHREKTGRQFDTVRGLFFEGEDLYPNAGFKIKNHIQICVRNPNCIKGYFLPRMPDNDYPIP